MIRRAGLTLTFILALAVVARVQPAPAHRHLLLVLDGLRPDYVTKEVMPNLYALAQRGVTFTNHHAVYPTVTRVNASSISTGAYPERHGILGNSVFFPRVDANRFLDTAQRGDLERIARDQDGVLLTTATLGEILRANGKKLLAVGSGTTGAVFLLNHTVAGGAVLHTEYALPAQLHDRMLAELGPPPPAAHPNDARNSRAVNAFFRIGLPTVDPAVTMMWLNDPDTTAHALGMGHPTTVEALRRLDREVLNIQEGLRAAGLFDVYNIWVTSDHGFATYTGAPDVRGMLKPFAGTLPDGSPRIAYGETAIYVRDGDRQIVRQIVRALQATAGIGAIFTQADRPGSLVGSVEGTLSFDVARGGHARTGAILYSPDWTDATNAHGMAGTSASNGVAGHGSSSPFEIHNTLIAAGPDIKQQTTVNIPSGNVDFAPTLLRVLGLPIPSSMQGRPLVEALRTPGPGQSMPSVRQFQQSVATSDRTYSQTAFFSVVRVGGNEYRYLDYAKATRATK